MKRDSSSTSVCIVCGKYAGKHRKDRQPSIVSAEYHSALLDFLQLPADYLQNQGVKCHIQYCQHESVLHSKLTRNGAPRSDIADLHTAYQKSLIPQENETAEECQMGKKNILAPNLESLFEIGVTSEEGLKKLWCYKQSSYSLTFLPPDILLQQPEEKQQEYLEICDKK